MLRLNKYIKCIWSHSLTFAVFLDSIYQSIQCDAVDRDVLYVCTYPIVPLGTKVVPCFFVFFFFLNLSSFLKQILPVIFPPANKNPLWQPRPYLCSAASLITPMVFFLWDEFSGWKCCSYHVCYYLFDECAIGIIPFPVSFFRCSPVALIDSMQ